jgi:hypothetical protein
MPVPRPPVLTLLQELLSWSIDRAEGFPRSHRFTLTERLLNHSLDAQDLALEAAFSPAALQSLEGKKLALHRLNLLLEKLRVLWRLVHERKFVSQQQLFFAVGKIDEIGRMTGGWLKSLDARKS